MTGPTILEQISAVFGSSPEHIKALVISGAGGAFVRAVYAPESSWRKRAFEGAAGALSAIFLGGVVGHVINMVTDAGTYAYLAGGFIMGEGGIAAVHAVRRKFLGEDAK